METIGSIFLLVTLAIGFFYVLYKIGEVNEDKVYGTPIYARLCNFEYFVRECSITWENYNTIDEELKEIRARKEMSDYVFCNKVNEIGINFEKRFGEWIQTQDVTKLTN
jgi:hypothetical protein